MTGADGFSLTNCGPVDRALARIGLKSRDPPHLYLRAFVPAAVIRPLLALALLRPEDGAEATVSLFEDFSTHVRFLVVVPLLVISDAPIGRRTGIVSRASMRSSGAPARSSSQTWPSSSSCSRRGFS